ncbi:MAG: hypothetical protein M8861_09950 [marine benthic group bacterium]|nr:hypothetical protein [Gemmatimonadota bacterium]
MELHSVSQTEGAIVDSAIAGQNGQFDFSFPESTEAGTVFLVGARYGGVLYWGPPIHPTNPDELADYSVAVFDTALVAGPVGSLKSEFRHVVVTPGPAGLQIAEIIDVEGVPERTLLPSGDSVFVWAGALAGNAHAVFPAQGGVPPQDLAVRDGTIGFAGALPPTGIRVAVEYMVSGTEYALRVEHPTERLELLVMPRAGMTLQVDGLAEASVGSDMAVPLRRFTATDLSVAATVSVRVGFEEPGRGQAWVWFAVALALGAAAVLSQRLTRKSS